MTIFRKLSGAIMKLKQCVSGVLCTLATALLLPTSAWSQDDGAGLEEITVTAQRREQSLQDTPVSITAFTPDRLNVKEKAVRRSW